MKTVVITGSTRGIGLGMANEFLDRGHQVVISGTSEASVSKAMDSIEANKENVIGVPCLVQDIKSVQNLWDQSMTCLLYTSPSPRDRTRSRMPSSA